MRASLPTDGRPRRSSSSRWPWVVLLVSGLVLAVTVPLYRARSSVRTQFSVVTITPSAQPPRECDVGFAGCSVVAVRPTTLRAVQRRFPAAVLVDSYGLSDGGRVDTEFVQVRLASAVVISVQSHCGGAGSVPDRTYGAVPGRASGDPAASGRAASGSVQVFVAGGATGCSVAVTVAAPAGATAPAEMARALAHDAVLALS